MNTNIKPERSRIGRRTYVVIACIAIAAVLITTWQVYPILQNPQSPSSFVNLPTMSLTMVALNGTQLTLNSTDIGKLPSVRGEGGFKTSAGYIRGIGNYTGVSIETLCNLIGGINSDDCLRVTADDGYSMVYTYQQVNGENFTTFNAVTGDESSYTQPFTTILAYHENDANLSSDDGPLRLATIGPEKLVTEGHFWIKSVVKIEILPSVREWVLTLKGFLYENMTRATFESGTNPTCPHGTNWTDSNHNVWSGIPLWLLVGRVDDTDQHEGQAFNRTLADIGYTVRITTGDGYTLDLNSSRVKLNYNIVVANELNGAALPEPYWPLRLVGSDLTSEEMMRNVVMIEIIFHGS